MIIWQTASQHKVTSCCLLFLSSQLRAVVESKHKERRKKMLVLQDCCRSSASAGSSDLIRFCSPPPYSSSSHLDFFLSHPNNKPKPRQFCLSPRNRSSICFNLMEIAHNKVLIAAGVSAAIGQLSKPFTSVLLYRKDSSSFDFRSAFQAGGFPSTHSSAVVAAATCLALERGFSDSIFGLTVVYAGLIMYDAQGVRREVGSHAKVLNRVLLPPNSDNAADVDVDDDYEWQQKQQQAVASSSSTSSSNELQTITTTQALLSSGNNSTSKETSETSTIYCPPPLKESIGHTEIEVIGGAVLGFLVSLLVFNILS